MQDPNNPDDEEFFDDDFSDFDAFDEQADDIPPEAISDETPMDMGGEDDMDDPFMNEGWDDFDESGNGTADQAYKPAKKGLSFNTIVIGIALIVGLGVLVYQVMTTKSSGSGMARFQSVLDFTGSTDGPVLGQQAQNAAPEQAPPAENEGGFLNDPGLLDDIARDNADSANPPMPTPISNDMDDQGAPQDMAQQDATLTPMPTGLSFEEAQATQVPRSPDDVPPVEPVGEEPSPAMDIIRKAQQEREGARPPEPIDALDATPEDIAMAQEDPAPVSEPEPEPAPAPEPDLAAEESEPEPEPEPELAAEPAPPPPQTSAADPAAEEAMKEQIRTLTDRLSVMKQEIIQVKESRQREVEELEQEIDTLKSELKEARATQETTAAPAPKQTVQKPAAPKKQASKPAPVKAAATGPWELRAAQPGRAWVSRAGAKEMQSVEPGDTLAGIGTIQRIDYAGGRWTVVGTQGSIRQ